MGSFTLKTKKEEQKIFKRGKNLGEEKYRDVPLSLSTELAALKTDAWGRSKTKRKHEGRKEL